MKSIAFPQKGLPAQLQQLFCGTFPEIAVISPDSTDGSSGLCLRGDQLVLVMNDEADKEACETPGR